MFPGNAEYVAHKRHQAMLREAKRGRLVKMAGQVRHFKRIVGVTPGNISSTARRHKTSQAGGIK